MNLNKYRIKSLPRYQGDKQSEVYTYQNNPEYFDNRAVLSKNERINDLFRKMIYAGTHGYDPKTGSIVALKDKATRPADPLTTAMSKKYYYRTAEDKKQLRRNRAFNDLQQLYRNPVFLAPGMIAAAGTLGPQVMANPLINNPYTTGALTGLGTYDAITNSIPSAYKAAKEKRYLDAAGNTAMAALDLSPWMFGAYKALRGSKNIPLSPRSQTQAGEDIPYVENIDEYMRQQDYRPLPEDPFSNVLPDPPATIFSDNIQTSNIQDLVGEAVTPNYRNVLPDDFINSSVDDVSNQSSSFLSRFSNPFNRINKDINRSDLARTSVDQFNNPHRYKSVDDNIKLRPQYIPINIKSFGSDIKNYGMSAKREAENVGNLEIVKNKVTPSYYDRFLKGQRPYTHIHIHDTKPGSGMGGLSAKFDPKTKTYGLSAFFDSQISAGKAFKLLGNTLKKGDRIKEKTSLSFDSFKNLLNTGKKQTKDWNIKWDGSYIPYNKLEQHNLIKESFSEPLRKKGMKDIDIAKEFADDMLRKLGYKETSKIENNKLMLPNYMLIKKQIGGEMLNLYNMFVNGDDKTENARKMYNKLNAIFYDKAKSLNMSSPNYIMTYLID